MTSDYLQKKFISFLKRNKYDFCFETVNVFGKESDILAYKDYVSHEFEFKIGEADFRKDIKKNRHINGSPNFFYYVVSDISVINGDYLDYAGIYLHRFSSDGQSLFRLIKEPKMIKEQSCTHFELYTFLRKIFNGKRVVLV